jgi:hypothetical protein
MTLIAERYRRFCVKITWIAKIPTEIPQTALPAKAAQKSVRHSYTPAETISQSQLIFRGSPEVGIFTQSHVQNYLDIHAM